MRFVQLATLLSLAAISAVAADKQILLIAGAPSHPPGQHEHNAGVLLMTKWLGTVKGVHATPFLSAAWPDNAQLEKADAIFVFSDGEGSHPVFKAPERIAAMQKAADRGAGIMFFHYATEPPKDVVNKQMLDWIGGFFEVNYSVNPHWDAKFESLPKHPITSGVKPFTIRDEWYYNIRFAEGTKNFTPILSATPPRDSVNETDGPRNGNADVRSKRGQPHVVAWAIERPNKGRGVGWTGGHHHKNWSDENFRKLALNALLWVAKADIPREGVQTTVTEAEMSENLDPKPARRSPAVVKPAGAGSNPAEAPKP
ncbi:MAG TPA: ThuA domain-containing protein [Bryobacteraceae bacterium]|nr:ThuA domain-containing protein [Bryobacteraceae bacterium]